jgi:hypothetical protein
MFPSSFIYARMFKTDTSSPTSFEVLIFGLPPMVHPVVGGATRIKQIEDQAKCAGYDQMGNATEEMTTASVTS